MELRLRVPVVLCAIGLWGCGASNELPHDLPALPDPPPPPPAVRPVKPVSADLQMFTTGGKPLSGQIAAKETVHSKITFRLPDKSQVPKFVIVQIGKRSRDGRFVIHNEKGGRPVRNDLGDYHVEVDIRGPLEPGSYTMHAKFDKTPFVESPLRVVLPSTNVEESGDMN